MQGEPRFLYAVNNRSETLSIYDVTNEGADLQHLSFVETGPDPVHVSTSPDGSLVAVCNYGADDVSLYRVDPSTGLLDSVRRVACGGGPVASVFHPSGRFLYVANSRSDSVSKFSVDTATGTVARISGDSNAGVGPQAMVLSKDGSRLYMINSLAASLWVYAVDDATGQLSPFKSVRTGVVPLGLALHPDGTHLYLVGGVTRGRLLGYDLDPLDGRPTPMSGTGEDLGLDSLPVSTQVSADGSYLYVALRERGEFVAVALDAQSGRPGAADRFLLGGGARPEVLVVQAGGRRMLIVDGAENEISTWDLSTPGLPTQSRSSPAIRTQDGPLSVAYGYGKVSSGPRSEHVFVANSGDGTLGAWSIDSKLVGGTGQTSQLSGSPVMTGNLPEALALHPTRSLLYAAGRVGISIFALDDGRLLARTGVLTGDHVDLAMGRRGKFVYGIEGGYQSRLQPYAIGADLGTLDRSDLQFVPTGRLSSRAALDPTGRFLYVANRGEDTISNMIIDVHGGQPIPLKKTSCGRGPSAIAVHPSGRWAYVALEEGGEIMRSPIDPVTGALDAGTSYTKQLSSPGSRPMDLTVDPHGQWLYVADPTRELITQFAVDEVTGFLVEVDTVKVYKPVQRLQVDASGRYLLASYDNGSRGGLVSFMLDLTTGKIGSSTTSLTGSRPRSIVVDRRND